MKKTFLLLTTSILSLTLFGCSSNNTFTSETLKDNNTFTSKNNTTMEKYGIITTGGELTSQLTFALSDKVNVEKVIYTNRYGITLAAHLYTAKDIDKSQKYPAIVIGTPYGGVKEQGAGIYAQNMAERGFVAMTFDESFNGESEGEPRHTSSPDIFVEDFSAGVDFLGMLDYVDRDKIGVIGICGAGGFSLTVSQVDPRIKAVVTASMYDISSMHRDGFGKTVTPEQRETTLKNLAQQRWIDFASGSVQVPAGFPTQPSPVLPEGMNPVMSEFFEYYAMKRGFHPNAQGAFTTTSPIAFMNFPLMTYISTNTTPKLLIMGENAHSRYYTEEAYEKAAEPKELYIVPGARHIDLYDGGINGENYIPFDKIETFFKTNLK